MRNLDFKILVIVNFFILLGLVALCRADDVPLKWDKVTAAGCVGYAIEMSVDLGQTWVEVWSNNDPNVVTTFISDVQSNAIVLFRAASLNAAGDRFPMTYAGAWYDGGKKPIAPPGGIGVP